MGMTADHFCPECDVFDFAPHPPDVCLRERTARLTDPTSRFQSWRDEGKGLRPSEPMRFSEAWLAANVVCSDCGPAKVLTPREERAVAEIERRRKACVDKARKALGRWMEDWREQDLEDAIQAIDREDSLDYLQTLIEDPNGFEERDL